MAGKVRILKEKLFKVKKDDTKLLYVEGACDNDATPPQGNYVTGSAFENVTTGNKYKYSETSGDWVLQPSEGGGNTLVVTITGEGPFVMDKTYAEIKSAVFTSPVIFYNTEAGEGYYAGYIWNFSYLADYLEEPGSETRIRVVGLYNTNVPYEFYAASDDDYPATTE